MSEQFDLLIIGGGAAGLWAAGTAAARGLRVLLLEKNNKLGVKILMSGGTRCNITHHCDASGIVEAFGKKQGRFLKHAVYALPPSTIVDTIEDLGVATKVEETGKVFPISNRAIDVRDALVRRAQKAGAKLHSGVAVESVEREEHWRVHVAGGGEFESKHLLICCGGLSYAGCGTTGDGYAWARQCGHTTTPTAPALTPLVCSENWVHELSGVTLPDVQAQIRLRSTEPGYKAPKEPRMSSRGGFLWTHFGFSGPVPMNVSRYVSSALHGGMSSAQAPEVELIVDLAPDLSEADLAGQFDASGKGHQHNTRQLGTLMQSFVPKSLANALLNRASVEASRTIAELPAKARLRLLEDMKRLRLPIFGTRGYPKAEVTSGGVALQEVNPKTMESRVVSSLYFAGEILDLDGPIGGYNFQAAFSTGHAAALAIPTS